MSVGAGIFWGCVFISLVFLFIKTKQSWNWKKITLWTAAILIGVPMLSFAYISIADYFSNRPKLITQLDGISLNDRLRDVVFKKGEFQPSPDLNDKRLLFNSDQSIRLEIEDNTVVGIAHFCKESFDMTRVNGIYCGATGDQIIENFGKKVRHLCAPANDDVGKFANLLRAYDVPQYGVRYLLLQNEVIAILIATEEGLNNYKPDQWEPC